MELSGLPVPADEDSGAFNISASEDMPDIPERLVSQRLQVHLLLRAIYSPASGNFDVSDF